MCHKKSYLRLFFMAVALMMATFSLSANSSFFKDFDLSKLGGSGGETELLPDTEAFQIIKSEIRDGQLAIQWLSAPDYYLYRKNFAIVSHTPGVTIGDISLPKGELEDDPLFGDVEVYFDKVVMMAPISLSSEAQKLPELLFKIHAQGCNKPVGICYPPQERDVLILPSSGESDFTSLNDTSNDSEIIYELEDSGIDSSRIQTPLSSQKENSRSFWSYVLTAFGAGLLLVFTPCVLPMLPILSGLILGSNEKKVSRARAGTLSIAYVLGTAITYTAMGALAGAAGIQLQAYFQHPIAIIFMVVILIILALSMFGAFNIAMPSDVQSGISRWTNKLKSGSFFYVMIMGVLSALIVSACVSPLLITALGVAIQQGDPWLGASMMFAMAMGMGTFLIAFGFGASWLVPQAGVWMNRVKELFGFAVLAVAIIVASSLKGVPLLFLWSVLLLGFGFWCWRLSNDNSASGWSIVFKVIAVIGFLWGGAAFVGGLTGSQQITKPLSKLSVAGNNAVRNGVTQQMAFDKVTSVHQIEASLEEARLAAKPVLVDYYADWCTDCKRMDVGTYSDARIIEAFSNWQLIKIDVTKVDDESQAAKDYYKVFGPPATLFIDSAGNELKHLRRYGYIKENDMLELASQVSRVDGNLDGKPGVKE